MKHEHRCCMCGRIDKMKGKPKKDARYICPPCFQEVQKEAMKQGIVIGTNLDKKRPN